MVTMIKSSLCFFISVLGCLANETPQELEVSRKILFDGQSLEIGRSQILRVGEKLALMEMEVPCLNLA